MKKFDNLFKKLISQCVIKQSYYKTDPSEEILSLLDEGILDQINVLLACLKYLSSDNVIQMANMNQIQLNNEKDPADQIILMVQDGYLDARDVIIMCLKYMSADQVLDMSKHNDCLIDLSKYDYDQQQEEQVTQESDSVLEGQDPKKLQQDIKK